MPTELRWDDAEDLGLLLADKFPHQNPLEVRMAFVNHAEHVVNLSFQPIGRGPNARD